MNSTQGWDEKEVDALACIEWLGGGAPLSEQTNGADPLDFALVWCLDGVCWGRFVNGTWQLAHGKFPMYQEDQKCGANVPNPTSANLLEARLFGPDGEIHIWAEDGTPGSYNARWILDPKSTPDNLEPLDRQMVLFGDRVLGTQDGFSLIVDGAGQRQVVPWEDWEGMLNDNSKANLKEKSRLVLKVRDYFEVEESGRVRIAVSRLRSLGEYE